MSKPLLARRCPECAGEALALKSNQVAEDAVETWVECACGARGECVEDARADSAGAVAQWNRCPVERAPLINDNAPEPLMCTLLERDAHCPRLINVAFSRPPTPAELVALRQALAPRP